MLNFPFIGVRAVHFASTVMVAGLIVFLVLVEAPALGADRERARPELAAYRRRLLSIAWLSLAISVASGAAWLLLLASTITGSPLARVISDGKAKAVLTYTQFGHSWEARFVLAILLGTALLRLGRRGGWRLWERFVAVGLSLGFLGALAWSGHGGATPGLRGEVHVTADVLHLIAAGAWIGGLIPLGLLLSSVEQTPDTAGLRIARDVTLRFSALGVTAVATLIVTGVLNTWVLVGSVPALVDLRYGRLLLLKIAIFLVMLAVAAINRTRLAPRLSEVAAGGSRASIDALRRLKRNCLVESVLGLAILIVVGALGTISPGMDMQE